MRTLLPLLFFLTLCTCDRANEVTGVTTTPLPDRGGAIDSTMALTPRAIEPETVFDYEDILWSFRFLPGEAGEMIATDKSGKLLIIRDGRATEVSGVPAVKDQGQGGLLDVLLDQEFEANRYVYLSYSEPAERGDDAGTTVARARLSDDMRSLGELEILYRMGPKTGKSHHFGSRMAWGRDGKLYFTIGDRGDRDRNPQDITRDGGKVYRINADGSIPQDNPFVGQRGAKEATYSYGHRNLQGLIVHPVTGELWEHEHGPRGGDEINLPEAGKNYGWPVITYGINYDGSQITPEVAKEGMEQPLHYWVPSIAPSGMAFITGDNYPGWEGDLLVGSLKFMYIQHVRLDGKEVIGEDVLIKGLGRVRDVRMGPDGWAYASVEGVGIVRLGVKG